MNAACMLLDEANAAGVGIRLVGGRLKAGGNPPLDLLTRLRAHKAALTALLSGNVCRHCGRPMAWPAPVGVILADGTAEHHECRLLVAGQRAVAGIAATNDAGEMICPGDES